MRKIAFIILFIATNVYSQQLVLEGQVSVHNSKYNTGEIEYVQNASIIAPFTKPATTDINGNFQLEFVGLDPGTAIKLQAEKSGLEVVNQYNLQQVIISSKLPLRIYLATKGKLAEAQTELYNINKKELFARKDAIIKRLRKDNEDSKKAITELEVYFGYPIKNRFEAETKLIEKISELEKRLPAFAQDLAKKNLDFASDLYIEAYEHFKKGNIEKTIQVLDTTHLNTSYLSAIKTIKEGEKLSEIGNTLQQNGRIQIEQLIESYKLKANALDLLFKFKESISIYHKIIAIYLENNLDKIELADLYTALGSLYLEDGKYDKSIANYESALKIKSELLDEHHPDLATAYSFAGIAYRANTESEKAFEYQQKALTIRESVLDSLHPDLAQSYDNLAGVFQDQGDNKKALSFRLKAISIQEKVLDSLDPDLATSYNNIGVTYKRLGNKSKDLYYSQKALDIREKSLDPLHPDLPNSYMNIAVTLKKYGELDTALKYQIKAIDIREFIYDSLHPALANTYNNLAVTYHSLKDYNKELSYIKKAVNIREKVLDSMDPILAGSYYNISKTYSALEEYDMALKYHAKSHKIFKQVKKHLSGQMARSFYGLGGIYLKMKDYERARVPNEEALKISQEIYKPGHRNIERCLAILSVIHFNLENYDLALDYRIKGLEIIETLYGTTHHLATENRIYLANIYLKLKNKSDAVKQRDIAEEAINALTDSDKKEQLLEKLKEFNEELNKSKE